MADTSQIENKIGLLIWKTSNFWQSKIRKILLPYHLTMNEFLVLQSINNLRKTNLDINQKKVSLFIGIDTSVTSITLKLLEKKKYIIRKTDRDNRKKNIYLLNSGINLYNIVYPLVQNTENEMFNKLNNETFNFTNSLKLLLGKKIRIRALKE